MATRFQHPEVSKLHVKPTNRLYPSYDATTPLRTLHVVLVMVSRRPTERRMTVTVMFLEQSQISRQGNDCSALSLKQGRENIAADEPYSLEPLDCGHSSAGLWAN